MGRQASQTSCLPESRRPDPDIGSKAIALPSGGCRPPGIFTLTILRYQAPIVAPALPFQSFGMRIASVRAALSSRTWRRRVELAVLLANLCLYLFGGLFVLSPWQAIGFVLLPRSYGSLLRRTVRPEYKACPGPGNGAGRLLHQTGHCFPECSARTDRRHSVRWLELSD